MSAREGAEEVLIAHQRHRGGCLCGYAELGRSHAGHQVAMLCEAGLPPRAEPSPWRFDVPEVPDSVTAFKDDDDGVWLRLPGNQWALLTWGLEYIRSCEKHAAEGHKAGYPLIDLLHHQPLVECEDPRGTG